MNQLPSRMLAILVAMTSGCAFASASLPKLDCARKQVRPKLLIVAVDGVRSDALAIAGTPRLLELASHGALSLDTRAVDIPKSGPGWSTVFTGVWRDRHRVDSNSFTFHALDDHPDLIARLERAHPELSTSFVHSWPPLHRFAASADHERDCTNEEDFDGCSLDESLRELGESDVDVMVVYLRGVDEAGHTFGFHPNVPEYLERLRWSDAAI